jgi:hypothetical protein
MSHIRGVKLERIVIVPLLPPTAVPSIPAFRRTRYLGGRVAEQGKSINRRILNG